MLTTILMWSGLGYLGWVLSGYLAFRLVNKVQRGRRLFSNHFWDDYSTSATCYWSLTPAIGLRYMFLWGAPVLLISIGVLSVRGIQKVYRKQFANGIDHSLAANRFFGIK